MHFPVSVCFERCRLLPFFVWCFCVPVVTQLQFSKCLHVVTDVFGVSTGNTTAVNRLCWSICDKALYIIVCLLVSIFLCIYVADAVVCCSSVWCFCVTVLKLLQLLVCRIAAANVFGVSTGNQTAVNQLCGSICGNAVYIIVCLLVNIFPFMYVANAVVCCGSLCDVSVSLLWYWCICSFAGMLRLMCSVWSPETRLL